MCRTAAENRTLPLPPFASSATRAVWVTSSVRFCSGANPLDSCSPVAPAQETQATFSVVAIPPHPILLLSSRQASPYVAWAHRSSARSLPICLRFSLPTLATARGDGAGGTSVRLGFVLLGFGRRAQAIANERPQPPLTLWAARCWATPSTSPARQAAWKPSPSFPSRMPRLLSSMRLHRAGRPRPSA